MAVQSGQCIEIDFTAKLKSTNTIFDTTKADDAKTANLSIKNPKPFTLIVGQHMLPEGLDQDLVGKEVGKEYNVEISPNKAFGERKKELIKMVPTKLFHQQKINPQRGMQLNLDGQTVTIMSSSGGRTLVDFNHPLAGKEIIYIYKINKEITDDTEKINALQDFLFRQRFEFKIKDKTAILEGDKQFEPIAKMFSDKFKEMIGFELDFKVKEESKEAKKANK